MSRFNWDKNGKGQINIVAVLMVAIMAIVVAVFVPIINTQGISGAVSRLEIAGYTVIASADYDALLAKVDANSVKLDDVKTAALAAVTKAEAAALTSDTILDTLLLHNENEVFLFPDSTVRDVTFVAGTPGDTYGAWAEVADNSTATLSTQFATKSGYIVELLFREYSVADKICVIELAYDDDGTDILGRVKVRADFTWVLDLRSKLVPAGSTIYYRMKSEQAGETAKVDFRYYYK